MFSWYSQLVEYHLGAMNSWKKGLFLESFVIDNDVFSSSKKMIFICHMVHMYNIYDIEISDPCNDYRNFPWKMRQKQNTSRKEVILPHSSCPLCLRILFSIYYFSEQNPLIRTCNNPCPFHCSVEWQEGRETFTLFGIQFYCTLTRTKIKN